MTYLTPDEKTQLRKHLSFIPEGVLEAGQAIDGNNPVALLQTVTDMIKDLETLRDITFDIVEAGEP